jgi:hypothetical protein
MGAACTHSRKETCIQTLVGKPEGKRLVRRLTQRYKDDIKMDIGK